MLHALNLASSPPTPNPTQGLPPEAQAKVLLIAVGIALIILLGLVAITLVRRIWRTSAGQSAAKSGRPNDPSKALSPWEHAGRRASPIDAAPGSPGPPKPDSSGDTTL